MSRERGEAHTEKTFLLDCDGHLSYSRSFTDCDAIPCFEQLEERILYGARADHGDMINAGLNSLVVAASELLSEVIQIKHGYTPQDAHALKERLVSALKRFEIYALDCAHQSNEVMAARYVLCSVLDEAVLMTQWGNDSDWSQSSLLSSFHNETFGGEKFFKLLTRLSKNPIKHLSMLELMYVCLALGFEGRYRVQPRGMLELEDIRDALFRQIRQIRGDVPRQLSPHGQGLGDDRRNVVRIIPAWMVVMFAVVCMLILYSGFAWVLKEQRESALQAYQVMDNAAVSPQSQP